MLCLCVWQRHSCTKHSCCLTGLCEAGGLWAFQIYRRWGILQRLLSFKLIKVIVCLIAENSSVLMPLFSIISFYNHLNSSNVVSFEICFVLLFVLCLITIETSHYLAICLQHLLHVYPSNGWLLNLLTSGVSQLPVTCGCLVSKNNISSLLSLYSKHDHFLMYFNSKTFI